MLAWLSSITGRLDAQALPDVMVRSAVLAVELCGVKYGKIAGKHGADVLVSLIW